MRSAAVSLLALALAAPVAAQTATTISLDPKLSLETGAHLTFAATSNEASLQSLALRRLNTKKVAGPVARLAWTVFIDHPVAVSLVVIQHEAFGHGGRTRELGSTASFAVGWPWTTSMLFRAGTRFGSGASFDAIGLSNSDIQSIRAAGVESNGLAASIIARDLVAGRAMRPAEWLYFIRSRLYVTQYALRTPDPVTQPSEFYAESQGGDFAAYLRHLSVGATGDPGISPTTSSALVRNEYDRIRRKAAFVALDPAVWLSAWSLARQIATGEEALALSVPIVAGHRVLPVVSSEWLTDGGVASLELVAAPNRLPREGEWRSLTLRAGNGPSGRMLAAGVAMSSAFRSGPVAVGATLEMWTQPSTGHGWGLVVRTRAVSGSAAGVYADIGYKTPGDWPGRPVFKGLFGSLGIRAELKGP